MIDVRTLLYSAKNAEESKTLVIRLNGPHPVAPEEFGFEFAEGAAWCEIDFGGLLRHPIKVYGADSLQALQLAADVDPYLRHLTKTSNQDP